MDDLIRVQRRLPPVVACESIEHRGRISWPNILKKIARLAD
jgi:hypothetical protein